MGRACLNSNVTELSTTTNYSVHCRELRLSPHQRPCASFPASATSATYTEPHAGKCQILPGHLPATSGAHQLSNSAGIQQRTCGTFGRHSQLVGARHNSGSTGLRRRVTSSWALPVRGSSGRICYSELAITSLGSRLDYGLSSSPSVRHNCHFMQNCLHRYLASTPAEGTFTCPCESCTWRVANQRSRSNGSADCATWSRSGTSFLATAHTAFVLQPPFLRSIDS